MMAPGTRLLVWAGAVMVPCAAIVAAFPPAGPAVLAVVACLAAAAFVDAAMGIGRLDRISVSFASPVRLTKDREGKVEAHVTSGSPGTLALRLGVSFPAGLTAASEEIDAALGGDRRDAAVSWTCTPHLRGRYAIDGCHLETASPLGLWVVRAARPANVELRVYPNLLPEQKNLGGEFLNRGTPGVHAQPSVGRGREFEKLREYVPGDCFGDVHWKATAKRGRPITKIFQVERTQEVYAVVDASRLSARTVSASSTIMDRYVTAALVLGLVAARQGDRFGLVTFSDQVRGFLRAGSGRGHQRACHEALYALQPRIVAPDFEDLAGFLRQRLRRRALLVFLTDLADPVLAGQFTRAADLLRRKHLVFVNMVRPPLVAPLFSDDAVSTVDDLYVRLAGHIRWADLRELGKMLGTRGVRFGQFDHEHLCVRMVSQYMSAKRRQAL